jgi:trehalose 6-phosphate synthase/phosphatase
MASTTRNRLVIVSNRLPVTVVTQDGEVRLESSSGGLATGLAGAHERRAGLWVGWPGDTSTLTDAQAQHVRGEFDRQRIVPVELSTDEVERYYEGFSNSVVWPLFHYLLDRVPLDANEWDTYYEVNRKFADAIARVYEPGDLVWVHDYQLMLVPGLLRERVPHARIGFFLHIPFPSFEVFRILPWRRQLLEGLLGADLIGFHTSAYARYCITALRHILDLEPNGQEVRYGGRSVRVGTFPMGIDVEQFTSLATAEPVLRDVAKIREQAGPRRILLGIDRLDYTKGIPRRLLAFERFLNAYPEWRDTVRFVQVGVPSRGGVDTYKAYRREVNELVGRINGAAGTVTDVPVHYLSRSVSPQELVALYRAADVMLVTPLRDGMNLVAKEFIAARTDEDGVLVLSEFAGAADELGEALIVNPFDIDGVADAIARALTMSAAERGARMRALSRRVHANTVHVWTEHFIRTLDAVSAEDTTRVVPLSDDAEIAATIARLRHASPLALLLDYDGTLVPLMDTPELAKPDAALVDLLRTLASRPNTAVHIIAGRGRETLDAWLGDLPVTLWAEHGLWRRDAGQREWRRTMTPSREWMQRVRPVLEAAMESTPGSLIENKSDSLAWHYRMSDAVQGVDSARALQARLEQMFPAHEVETIAASKVIEVRPHGLHKGLAMQALVAEQPSTALLVAIGDDRTDEDMFQYVPQTGLAMHVGTEPTRAAIRLADVQAVRSLLGTLAGMDPRTVVVPAAPSRRRGMSLALMGLSAAVGLAGSYALRGAGQSERDRRSADRRAADRRLADERLTEQG